MSEVDGDNVDAEGDLHDNDDDDDMGEVDGDNGDAKDDLHDEDDDCKDSDNDEEDCGWQNYKWNDDNNIINDYDDKLTIMTNIV